MGSKAKKGKEDRERRSGAAPGSGSESPAAWVPAKLASITNISSRILRGGKGPGSNAEDSDRGLGDWLPEGLTRARARDPETDGSEFAENAATTPEKVAKPEEVVTLDDVPPAVDARALEDDADERLRRAEERLRRAEQLLETAEARALEAEERGEKLNVDIEALQSHIQHRAESVAKASATVGKSIADAGRIDLNDATFEVLRGLGLSVTQSARLISQREQRRGFRSLEDLRTVWGIPRDVLEIVKKKTFV